ncbi:MAG: hypothetical protein Q8M94_00960, partial [Ignavibacteria bacterium]|nr:hypothetical protein [Ignavibacteria bacterium]
PSYPLFNRLKDINFEQFNDEDYIFLKSSLYLNLLENVNVKIDKADIFKIIDFGDKDLLPAEFIDNSQRIIFSEVNNLKLLFIELSNKEFISYKNNLIVFSDVINLRATDIEQYFNLLSIDDKSLVLAKSSDGIIKVLGFNSYSDELFKHLSDSSFMLDKFLSYNMSCDYFVNTLSDVMSVTNINDFKKLYSELSLKRSNEYCSQQMHERFTHLFVEYKDLLK